MRFEQELELAAELAAEKAREKALAEGEKIGKTAEALKIAKAMLEDGMAREKVARLTGLAMEEIEKIKI